MSEFDPHRELENFRETSVKIILAFGGVVVFAILVFCAFLK